MEISGHARKRMEKRSITEAEVRAVVSHPQWTTPGKPSPGRWPRVNLWARVEGRLIRVTLSIADQRVVTVVAPEEEGE